MSTRASEVGLCVRPSLACPGLCAPPRAAAACAATQWVKTACVAAVQCTLCARGTRRGKCSTRRWSCTARGTPSPRVSGCGFGCTNPPAAKLSLCSRGQRMSARGFIFESKVSHLTQQPAEVEARCCCPTAPPSNPGPGSRAGVGPSQVRSESESEPGQVRLTLGSHGLGFRPSQKSLPWP